MYKKIKLLVLLSLGLGALSYSFANLTKIDLQTALKCYDKNVKQIDLSNKEIDSPLDCKGKDVIVKPNSILKIDNIFNFDYAKNKIKIAKTGKLLISNKGKITNFLFNIPLLVIVKQNRFVNGYINGSTITTPGPRGRIRWEECRTLNVPSNGTFSATLNWNEERRYDYVRYTVYNNGSRIYYLRRDGHGSTNISLNVNPGTVKYCVYEYHDGSVTRGRSQISNVRVSYSQTIKENYLKAIGGLNNVKTISLINQNTTLNINKTQFRNNQYKLSSTFDVNNTQLKNGLLRIRYNKRISGMAGNGSQMPNYFDVNNIIDYSIQNGIRYGRRGHNFRNNYTTLYLGYLKVERAGTWCFGIDGDDAVDFLIDNNVITYRYRHHRFANRPVNSRCINLNKGYHKIIGRQIEDGGDDGILIYFRRPGSSSWYSFTQNNLNNYGKLYTYIPSNLRDINLVRNGLMDVNQLLQKLKQGNALTGKIVYDNGQTITTKVYIDTQNTTDNNNNNNNNSVLWSYVFNNVSALSRSTSRRTSVGSNYIRAYPNDGSITVVDNSNYFNKNGKNVRKIEFVINKLWSGSPDCRGNIGGQQLYYDNNRFIDVSIHNYSSYGYDYRYRRAGDRGVYGSDGKYTKLNSFSRGYRVLRFIISQSNGDLWRWYYSLPSSLEDKWVKLKLIADFQNRRLSIYVYGANSNNLLFSKTFNNFDFKGKHINNIQTSILKPRAYTTFTCTRGGVPISYDEVQPGYIKIY